MVTVRDVPVDLLVKRLAEHLRKVPHVSAPPWAAFIKTGSHAERPPQDREWWYFRCASLLRKLYLHGPVSVSDLRSEYGGRVRTGYSLMHHRDAGGAIIRKAFQQLEAAGLVEKKLGKGRSLSSKGLSLIDRLSNEIFRELAKQNPALTKYA